MAEKHGEGFEIDSIVDRYAVATREVAVTEIRQHEKSKTQEVRLPRTVKPSNSDSATASPSPSTRRYSSRP